MYQLGIDVGTSSAKLALLQDESIERTWIKRHHGRLLQTLTEGLEAIQPPDEPIPAAVTGANAQILTSRMVPAALVPAALSSNRRTASPASNVL